MLQVLHSSDFPKEFFLHCNARKTGVESVLVQLSAEGDEVPIVFMYKKINKTQRNYTVTEQECLATILSIKKYRPGIGNLFSPRIKINQNVSTAETFGS